MMSFFAFPLNLVLAVIWVMVIFHLYDNARNSKLVTIILSPWASIFSISLLFVFALYVGITGKREVVTSWPFVVVLFVFMTVLAFVILRGWKLAEKIRWRFLLNHLGLLLAVSSAFWGYPDSETLRLKTFISVPTKEAVRADGTTVWLPYEVELTQMDAMYHDDGSPMSYQVTIRVDDSDVELKVNHPYSRSVSEDMYLSGYDPQGQYCIIQIVREPWKFPAMVGILMMLAGALLLFIRGPQKR